MDLVPTSALLRKTRLLVGTLCALVALAGLSGCNQTPTTPTPTPPVVTTTSVAAVTPSTPVRDDAAQPLIITGAGFRAGLSLRVTDPAGAATVVGTSDIASLLPTSFQVTVMLAITGRYSLVVQQQDGETSTVYFVDVMTDNPNAPRIDSVSPALTNATGKVQQVTLIGANFDASLGVQILEPDGVIAQLTSQEYTIQGDTAIRFVMALTKVGTYRMSLWKGGKIVSNIGEVRVK